MYMYMYRIFSRNDDYDILQFKYIILTSVQDKGNLFHSNLTPFLRIK